MQVYFSRVERPSDAIKAARSTPEFVRLDDSVRVLRIKTTNAHHTGFNAGEEICVNYRRKPVVPCLCRSCVGAVEVEEEEGDDDELELENADDELLTADEGERNSKRLRCE
jgi:hypothetical protein